MQSEEVEHSLHSPQQIVPSNSTGFQGKRHWNGTGVGP